MNHTETENDCLPQVLLVHAMAEITGPDPARSLEARLLDALARFSPRITKAAQPYWKVPEWHECTVALEPADRPTFEAVVALAEGQWDLIIDTDEESCGDCDGVWNPEPGHAFLLPEVTWANVLLVTPNPVPPDFEFLPS